MTHVRLAELEANRIIGTTPLEGADMGGVRRAAERAAAASDPRPSFKENR